MQLIIPIAGQGKRMRPHTLTTPKPLIYIAGKTIVQRLIEGINKVCTEKITHVGFIINDDIDSTMQTQLTCIVKNINAQAIFFHQTKPLGTAHAILCARRMLCGQVIIAFGDTLFQENFTLDTQKEAIIWVKSVDNPSAFGVVRYTSSNHVIDFVEKPTKFVSNLAMVGIYYFQKATILCQALQYLIDNTIIKNDEFQLTDALTYLKKNVRFSLQPIDTWHDFGNPQATLKAHKQILQATSTTQIIHQTAKIQHSILIPPVYIGQHVVLQHSIIGPNVSIENNSNIQNTIIRDSIVQKKCFIKNAQFNNSIIGNHVNVISKNTNGNIGDYSNIYIQ